jgi:hypothetical protein
MRFGHNLSAVALMVLTAFTSQTVGVASAHGVIHFNSHHHISTPAPIQSVPVDNVKDFGALGNGTTDDQNAIQAAINDASSRHIGVYFPAGTYPHSSTLTFNGIPVSGAGGASVLLAIDPAGANTAVVLTGTSPSIQQLVISTAGEPAGTSVTNLQGATLLVLNATGCSVTNDSIVQGPGRVGIYLQKASVSSITSVTFNGPTDTTNQANDIGVIAEACFNVSVCNNLMMNEGTGISIYSPTGVYYSGSFSSEFMAVLSNQIASAFNSGVVVYSSDTLDVSDNDVTITNTNSTGYPIYLVNDANVDCSQNITNGGWDGIYTQSLGYGLTSSTNVVNQNTVRNCNSSGLNIGTICSPPPSVTINGNQMGECGLKDNGPTSSAINVWLWSQAVPQTSVVVAGNSYQGHDDNLVDYIYAPHVPAANVTGDTQSQTALPSVTGP